MGNRTSPLNLRKLLTSEPWCDLSRRILPGASRGRFTSPWWQKKGRSYGAGKGVRSRLHMPKPRHLGAARPCERRPWLTVEIPRGIWTYPSLHACANRSPSFSHLPATRPVSSSPSSPPNVPPQWARRSLSDFRLNSPQSFCIQHAYPCAISRSCATHVFSCTSSAPFRDCAFPGPFPAPSSWSPPFAYGI